jgi:hypothetical protein
VEVGSGVGLAVSRANVRIHGQNVNLVGILNDVHDSLRVLNPGAADASISLWFRS